MRPILYSKQYGVPNPPPAKLTFPLPPSLPRFDTGGDGDVSLSLSLAHLAICILHEERQIANPVSSQWGEAEVGGEGGVTFTTTCRYCM